jgi:hypothetical protein
VCVCVCVMLGKLSTSKPRPQLCILKEMFLLHGWLNAQMWNPGIWEANCISR